MKTSNIPYDITQTLSKLVQEVLNENPDYKPFYQATASPKNFISQIAQKSKTISLEGRVILSNCLKNQYQYLSPSKQTIEQIESLKSSNTFTITTGHQLNLLGGPLYFLYKIIAVINMAKSLQKEYPSYNFVPIFWMATEDHDFEEINHFNFGSQRFEWPRQSKGGVGRLDLLGLDHLFTKFTSSLDNNKVSESLKSLIEKSYFEQKNLADATRCMVHELFGKENLLVIDGDDKNLKKLFIPTITQELTKNIVFDEVSSTNERLKSLDSSVKIQVNPRSINLFYLKAGLRERIENVGNDFFVMNTKIKWTLEEILEELQIHPERFSPNVLMRPLYQETVLPNLCYVGGGGELAYWLQLKSCFDRLEIVYPLIFHRNSAIILSQKQSEDLGHLNLQVQDLFLSSDRLSQKMATSLTQLNLDFSKQKAFLREQFEALYDMAKTTDLSFVGAVAAQEAKQLKGLSNLEKRLLKAEKRKYKLHIDKAIRLQSALFPDKQLQERVVNFSFYYSIYGDRFIKKLLSELNPFQQGFSVIYL